MLDKEELYEDLCRVHMTNSQRYLWLEENGYMINYAVTSKGEQFKDEFVELHKDTFIAAISHYGSSRDVGDVRDRIGARSHLVFLNLCDALVQRGLLRKDPYGVYWPAD